MGFIPIFVALSGLILLYSIYTYNQIKPRKTRINQVIDQMAANSALRKQLIFTAEQQSSNAVLSEIAMTLKKSSTDRFQSFKKEEDLIEKIARNIETLQDGSTRDKLKEVNDRQKQLLKNLERFARDYNGMIKKAPAKFVAATFGFRPF